MSGGLSRKTHREHFLEKIRRGESLSTRPWMRGRRGAAGSVMVATPGISTRILNARKTPLAHAHPATFA